ncbi:phage major capsid protein [Aeromonas caviae]
MKNELIKRSLADTLAQMKAVLAKADNETRSLDEQELAEFNGLKAKAEGLKATIKAAEELEAAELRSIPDQKQSGAEKPAPTEEELRAWILDGVVSERSMTTGTASAVVIPGISSSIQEKMVAASPLRQLVAHYTTDALTYGVPVEAMPADVLPGDESTTRGECVFRRS